MQHMASAYYRALPPRSGRRRWARCDRVTAATSTIMRCIAVYIDVAADNVSDIATSAITMHSFKHPSFLDHETLWPLRRLQARSRCGQFIWRPQRGGAILCQPCAHRP